MHRDRSAKSGSRPKVSQGRYLYPWCSGIIEVGEAGTYLGGCFFETSAVLKDRDIRTVLPRLGVRTSGTRHTLCICRTLRSLEHC